MSKEDFQRGVEAARKVVADVLRKLRSTRESSFPRDPYYAGAVDGVLDAVVAIDTVISKQAPPPDLAAVGEVEVERYMPVVQAAMESTEGKPLGNRVCAVTAAVVAAIRAEATPPYAKEVCLHGVLIGAQCMRCLAYDVDRHPAKDADSPRAAVWCMRCESRPCVCAGTRDEEGGK